MDPAATEVDVVGQKAWLIVMRQALAIHTVKLAAVELPGAGLLEQVAQLCLSEDSDVWCVVVAVAAAAVVVVVAAVVVAVAVVEVVLLVVAVALGVGGHRDARPQLCCRCCNWMNLLFGCLRVLE
jgi:hypothetical protein